MYIALIVLVTFVTSAALTGFVVINAFNRDAAKRDADIQNLSMRNELLITDTKKLQADVENVRKLFDELVQKYRFSDRLHKEEVDRMTERFMTMATMHAGLLDKVADIFDEPTLVEGEEPTTVFRLKAHFMRKGISQYKTTALMQSFSKD
jgi:hypothetical protein